MNNRFFALAEAFVAVVRHNSITDAAMELRISKSSISQKLTEFEALLDVALLERTTRKMTLTPAGERVFRTCVGAVDATEKAAFEIGLVADLMGAPSGKVTLSASNTYLTNIVLPILPRFLAEFPNIKPLLIGSDRRVDFSAEDVDLGVRIGPVVPGKYRKTALKPLKRILCASPDLVEKVGGIRHPSDMEKLPFVLREQEKPDWDMMRGAETYCQRVSSATLVVNTIELSQRAVAGGIGVALLPEVVVGDDIKRGRLTRILPEWKFADIPVTLLSRQSKLGKPAVRMMHQHLVTALGVSG